MIKIHKGNQYCIYLRKSRMDMELELKSEEDTLKRHEETLLLLAAKNRYNIGKIYREVVSGETIASRPKMQQLLIDIENGLWDGVLVMEVERLARGDTIDQGIVSQTFKYSDTKIITPSRIYEPHNEFDEEYFEFGLFMSRQEYKKINQRLKRGREASVREGKYVGSIAPYGYEKKKLEKEKGYTLTIKEDEANVIRQIFKLYVEDDLSMSEVARQLNYLGYQPMFAQKWTLAIVRDILINPVYIGKIKWNDRKVVKSYRKGKMVESRPLNKGDDKIIVNGKHEAIVGEDIWHKAQIKKEKNRVPLAYYYDVKNIYAGLVYCGKCGAKMQRRPYSNGADPTLICPTTGCRNVSTKISIFEEQMLKVLKKLLKNWEIDFHIKKVENNPIDELEQSIKRTNEKLLKEQQKLDKICIFFEEGTYSKELFLSRTKQIQNSIQSLKNEIQLKEEKLEFKKSKTTPNETLIPKIKNVIDLLESDASSEDKNTLLKEILHKVVYTKNQRAVGKNADPTNFQLDIYPKQQF